MHIESECAVKNGQLTQVPIDDIQHINCFHRCDVRFRRLSQRLGSVGVLPENRLGAKDVDLVIA